MKQLQNHDMQHRLQFEQQSNIPEDCVHRKGQKAVVTSGSATYESAASGCLPRHRPGDWGGVHHRLNLDRAGLDSPRNGLDHHGLGLDHHGLGRGLFIDREG